METFRQRQRRLAGGSYAAKRCLEYPSVGDQLDAILDGLQVIHDDGRIKLPQKTVEMLNSRAAVKAKHPKD